MIRIVNIKKKAGFFGKILLLSMLILFIPLVAALDVQDDFDRADGAIGTATNGNAWGDLAGSTLPTVTSNQGRWYDSGTDPVGSLVFNEELDIGQTISWLWYGPTSNTADVNFWIYQNGSTEMVTMICTATGTFQVYNDTTLTTFHSWVKNTWYKYSVMVVDNETFNIYVDDVLIGNYIFRNGGSGDLNKIKLQWDYGSTAMLVENITIDRGNFTLTAEDIVSSAAIDNFSALVNGVAYNSVDSRIVTNYTLESPQLINITFYNATGFVNRTYTNYNTSSNLVGQLYALNSVWVYSYDQSTGAVINDFNVTLQNEDNYYNASSSSGLAELDNVSSGSYVVTVEATNYTSSNYVIIMSDNSHQDLNAYLSASIDDVIFSVRDQGTNALIEDVLITQKKYIDGTLTIINSKYSDISGRVQFYYDEGILYTFTTSKTGYEDKTFNLIPLFDSYDLILTPTITLNEDVYIDDVTINIDDYSFTSNGNLSYITLTFESVGQLTGYSINVTSDYNNTFVSGTNANGETLNASLNISGAVLGDFVSVTYGYKSAVNSEWKYLTRNFMIENFTPGDGTIGGKRDWFANNGKIENIIIATIIAIILSSIVAAAITANGGDAILGGSFGMFMGFLLSYFLGLMSSELTTVVCFVLALMVSSRLGGDR